MNYRKYFRLSLGICTILVLIACTSNQVNSKSNTEDSKVETGLQAPENLESKSDSLLNINKVATDILNGASIWGKNENYLFQLMDSIISKDSIRRQFYLKVFTEIRKQSDGYLYESLGKYELLYLSAFPEEFFNLPDSILKGYAYQIGYEIIASQDDPLLWVDNLIKEIKEQIDRGMTSKIEYFSTCLVDAIESNLN